MPATITFSLEIELGWGLVQYDKLDALSPRRQAETKSLERLLNICDELEIPISFNVVGHLLLDNPLPSYEGNHQTGWFDAISRTDPDSDPQLYAPDLIEKIQSATVDHEICTHTFTHVECANVSRETLRWELDNVIEAHNSFGLEAPISIVPPRHSPPPRDILKQYNIEIIRSARTGTSHQAQSSNRIQLGKNILTGKQPIRSPQLIDGIIETYCTRYPSLTAPFLPSGQLTPHPAFRTIPLSMRKWLHSRNMRSILSTVINKKSYVHLWSHLWETANEIQWELIESFFHSIAEENKKGNIQIRRMDELNEMTE